MTHGYDNLERLTSTVTPSTTRGYGYDANGNRTSKIVGAVTQTYAYPSTNNKLTSITGGGSWTYTHDANGSITNDGTDTFGYDVRGRLVQATTGLGTVTYKLNALGQRYSKTVSGTTTVYLYDGSGKLIAETSDGGATYTQYVWLGDTPVAVLKPGTPTPAKYYIHADHLDTPRVITDSNQSIVWRWDNDDAFGGNVANQNPSGLGTFAFNLRFPGQYFDLETGNHYNYFRDYSPETGRYVQSDPIGLEGGLNTYGYASGDPVKSRDPLGLDPFGGGPFSDVPSNFLNTITTEGGSVSFPQSNPRGLTPYEKCMLRCLARKGFDAARGLGAMFQAASLTVMGGAALAGQPGVAIAIQAVRQQVGKATPVTSAATTIAAGYTCNDECDCTDQPSNIQRIVRAASQAFQ